MSDRRPTDEQSHILDLATRTDDNIMIDALAGCGKTSTLEMIERAVKTRPILYLVFNKRNAEEAEKRMLSTTSVRTFNSMGHRVWAKHIQRNQLKLDPKKSATILREIIDQVPRRDQGPFWEVYWDVINAVGMAKAVGYVPTGKYPQAKHLTSKEAFHACLEEKPDDLTTDLVDAVLCQSIKGAYDGYIDYNDQLYMPTLFGGTFPKFPLVKVDEYQDLSPIQHCMLDRLVSGRIIGVGDPWQNIYAFRGAKQGGMVEAKAKFKMTSATLSTSFRCPSEIVKNARWRVPHFKYIKEGGYVERLEQPVAEGISEHATIICRNNAPLFRVAFRLLSMGRSVSVAGSDLGPKLVALLRRMGPENLSRSAVLGAIDNWEQEKTTRESKTAADMAACMRVFAEHGDTLGQAISYADHLFQQKGTTRLLTGHKAKGLEFETVYFLDEFLLSRDEQDLNLNYVISTRSQNNLLYIDSARIKW